MKNILISDDVVLKEVIKKNLSNIELTFIEEKKNDYYDIVILTKEEKLNIKSLKCKYLIIDGDLSIGFINYIKSKIKAMYILTFGSNHKCTITFSSILSNDKAEYQICIQRSFKSLTDDEIFQQELKVECTNKNVNSNNVLLICTLMLLINNNIKNII